MLLRRRGPGAFDLSKGSELHGGHGVSVRLDEPRGRVGHPPRPADGVAVYAGGIRRWSDHDRVPRVRVPPHALAPPGRGGTCAGQPWPRGAMEGHAAMDMS